MVRGRPSVPATFSGSLRSSCFIATLGHHLLSTHCCLYLSLSARWEAPAPKLTSWPWQTIPDFCSRGKSQFHLKVSLIAQQNLFILLNLNPWIHVFLMFCMMKQEVYIKHFRGVLTDDSVLEVRLLGTEMPFLSETLRS